MYKMITCHYIYDNTIEGTVKHLQYLLKDKTCTLWDIELMDTPFKNDPPVIRFLISEEREIPENWSDWCKDGDIVYEFDRDTAYSLDRPNEKASYERWCKFKASEREAGRDIGTFLGNPFK